MKEMIRYGFILALICSVAAGFLAGTNALTRPLILRQAQASEEASLKAVMPQGEVFKPVKKEGELLYYNVYNKQNQFIGVVFKAAGKGYSSSVETIAGMLKDGTMTAIKVLAQNETPGLGVKVIEPNFIGQFSNKKDLSNIQAIAGATISSRAVIDSVKKKKIEIEELIKNGK